MILRDIAALRRQIALWKQDGLRIGFVPTMGALHAGHLSLVTQAQKTCDRSIVSIFVNPRQFNNPEDLQHYPRSEAEDLHLLKTVDAVFMPSVDAMYPPGFCTSVHVDALATCLEGAHRPGHFDGMATVVTKLLLLTQADEAYFGEKDWQQLQIVKRLAADLALTTRIVACPIVREKDGLAYASRNQRLTAPHRRVAPRLYEILLQTATSIREGMRPDQATAQARADLIEAGFDRVDYVACVNADSLIAVEAPLGSQDQPYRLLAAAALGHVRLIDTIAVTR